MRDPNAPGDDWQWDDIDWSEDDQLPAAGDRPDRQQTDLPAAGPRPGDQPSPEPAARSASVRRRRMAAIAAILLVLGCAVAIPLVVLGGGGTATEQTTPASTAGATTAVTTTPTTTTTTTTTTTSTTRRASLHVVLPAGTTLRRGDHGAVVTQLQKGLAALGFATGRPDGTFGATTEAAVVDFQRSNNLSPDGTVGTDTVRLLNSALAARQAG